MITGMPEMPLVTIAMVTYNSSAYIGAAIESVLSSSYPHFELLIADDCSVDNTWEIVLSYRDPRIRTIRNERNLGEYPNRDQCVRLAKGEYLIFIDGDDLMYPHGLEFMTRMLHAFPECGMALMYPYDKRIFLPVTLTPRDYYLNYYFGDGLLDVAFTNSLFRTTLLREIGGIPEQYKSGDDYVRLRVAALTHTLIISDQLTWWRISPGQASERLSSDPVRRSAEIIDIGNSVLSLPACPLNDEEKRKTRLCLAYGLKMVFLKYFKRLRFGTALRLLALKKLIPVSFFGMLSSYIDSNFDPLNEYSGVNPYRLELSRNPYAAKENTD